MMHTIQPKKLLIVNIIDILNRYTDSEHTLTQREIEDILKNDYLMDVDRKTVRRNLSDLIECDAFEIEYKETTRVTPKLKRNKVTGKMEPTKEMEETAVYTDFSIVRDFTEGELRYLIDGVFASKYITQKHKKDLIKKIEKLGGKYFKSHTSNINKETSPAVYSSQIFYTIGILDEAIQNRKKVKFRYKSFGLDKKANYRLDENGIPKEYVVSPYEMATKSGRYYLICCDEKHPGLSNYRIDRIADIQVIDNRARPLKELTTREELENYINERITYMYAGDSVKAKFKIRQRMIANVVDTFGENFTASDAESDENNGWVTISTKVNEDSLIQYAKSYAPDIIVISPQSTVDRIKEDLSAALSFYE